MTELDGLRLEVGHRSGHVETVVFNGLVDTIDPATGQPVRPCLITVRTTRDTFQAIDLGQVEPALGGHHGIQAFLRRRVVGIGTHHELLASNETYREIVYSQLSEEEAA